MPGNPSVIGGVVLKKYGRNSPMFTFINL